jgi:hypothetical protein
LFLLLNSSAFARVTALQEAWMEIMEDKTFQRVAEDIERWCREDEVMDYKLVKYDDRAEQMEQCTGM